MSETTAHLALPFIMAAQAQKHVTVNEALRLLDGIVQLAVINRDLSAPPASPADGARYIVATGATDVWEGWDGSVALWVDGAWMRLMPRTGWLVWIAAEGQLLVWNGSDWDEVIKLQENLSAQMLGLGGATADSYNRLSVNTPAVLLNNAGAGIEATVNKAVAANDAAFAFKTGFSARALIGLLGNDDFSFKVSPDGSAFYVALKIDRTNGRVELAEPIVLPAHDDVPPPPPSGRLALYGRNRAGQGWLDVQRPSGRHFPIQPHFGVNRVAFWAPSTGSSVNAIGMPRSTVGTVVTPTPNTSNLANSMRRWRITSAATAASAAEERSAGWVCWRGNAEGLGGFTCVTRLSLVTLQPTGMGFFGLIGSSTPLSTTLTLSTLVNALGIGFERGIHDNWQIVHNDGAGAPTVIDLGADFPVANTANVLTLYIAAAPNGNEVGIRVVEEVSGAVAEAMITTDMPAAAQLLSPRNYINNGSTAAAVAYDCSGVYVETDY